MVKSCKNGKNHKKNNKPFYMNNNLINGEQIKENHQPEKPIVIKKFQLGIDKNNNPIVTIDNTMHFMNVNQFNAFTLGIININKKLNPEVDYEKMLIKK